LSTFNALYLRAVDGDARHALHRRVCEAVGRSPQAQGSSWRVALPTGSPWVEVQCSGSGLPLRLLVELSARLGAEGVGLFGQTQVDAFHYAHVERGKVTRRLEQGAEEAGWLGVQGQPEAWEAPLFFSGEALNDALEASESADGRAEIQRTFDGKAIRRGARHPSASARDVVDAVCTAHALPLGASSRELDAQLRPGAWVDRLAAVTLVVGVALAFAASRAHQPGWMFAPLPMLWLAASVLLRRSSRVVSIGGGMVAAFLLLAAAGQLGEAPRRAVSPRPSAR
jgi:hypothetical protein